VTFNPPPCGCGLKAYESKWHAEKALTKARNPGSQKVASRKAEKCGKGRWHLVNPDRGAKLKPGGKLRFRSKKAEKQHREERLPLLKHMDEERPWCEIRWDEGCQGRAVDVDEIQGRGAGGSHVDIENVQSTCRYCHDKKHQNPAEAKARGFTRSAGGAR